jgi:hypothetical protein
MAGGLASTDSAARRPAEVQRLLNLGLVETARMIEQAG